MSNQFLPKTINPNPNLIEGNLLVEGDITSTGTITGRSLIPISAKITVPANTNYVVLITDRILLISTTIAGARTITLGDFDDNIFQLTIVMTAQNTGTYSVVTTLQGDFLLDTSGTAVTLIHLGDGIWTIITS